MVQAQHPTEERDTTEKQPRRGHGRRPPLAEIDSWELWQAWKRGERALVMRDIWRFLLLYKEFNWGRQIGALALERLFSAGYPQRRWL